MKLEATIGERRFRILQPPRDISIALVFDGDHPSAFGLPAATAQPFEFGDTVLRVARGGSVNCSTLTFTPHGNVTHTECIGHITSHDVGVLDVLTESFVAVTLVTVAPIVKRREGQEFPEAVVTLERLQETLRSADPAFLRGVVVRTLPNDSIKRQMQWSGTRPPYLQPEAMRWLVEQGVRHFFVDLPSVDPEQDEGRLDAHRAFWDGEAGRARTITELVFVPNEIADGSYMLELQVAPFVHDVLPCRPLLFSVEEVTASEH